MIREKIAIGSAIVGMVLLAVGTLVLAHVSTSDYREAVFGTPAGGATRIAN